MKTCKTCGNEFEDFMINPTLGTCTTCTLASLKAADKKRFAEIAAKTRQSACYTTTGRYQAGEFAIIGVSVRDQQVLLTLQGSTWMDADWENNQDAGDYTNWYEPTDEEKQHPEYQRLALQLAADQAHEEEMTERAQRNSEDPDIREYRAELDAEEFTGSPRIAEGRVARVEVRLTQTQKDMLQVFCQKTGHHLSTFMVTSALAAMRDEMMKHPSLFM